MAPARAQIVVGVIALAAVGGTITAGTASAHGGDDYDSVLEGVAPASPGISLRMGANGSGITAVNLSSRTLTIVGYDGEPYARIRPGGIVERNARSRATYLNAVAGDSSPVLEDASSDPATPPRWRVVARDGRFIWHDHRSHWMGSTRPAAVTDVHRRTRIFDWSIPIRVGEQPGFVRGTLYWAGRAAPAPIWPLALFVGAGAVAGTITLLANRRRRIRITRSSSAPRAGAGEA